MIDSTLFGADIPAGTYAVGDMIPLKLIDGPQNVRSGRGAALLKRITMGHLLDASGSATTWRIAVKNSDWVDPAESFSASIRSPTALDEKSGCIQRGHDCPLTPNSSWEVYAVCAQAATTTVANSIFALIDIDYPSVSSIVNPDVLAGIPATLSITTGSSIPLKATGTLENSTYNVMNIDFFKAGYQYALEKVESVADSGFHGFLALSNAAGMGGLKRIIPIGMPVSNIKNKIEYASLLVKGPMDISLNLFSSSGSATTGTVEILFDFVKRRM